MRARPGRARKPGGGRKRASVTDPGLVAALRALVDPDATGQEQHGTRHPIAAITQVLPNATFFPPCAAPL
jgi:hypothetical protein